VGKTLAEKVLARAGGEKEVSPGQIIEAEVDLAMTHDNNGPVMINQFNRLPGAKVWNPDRVVVIIDHHSPATSFRAAENHRTLRKFAAKHELKHFFDCGEGVSHVILRQKGFVKPGMVMVGSDSHSVAGGALGAFATGIGATEMAAVLARGKLWLRVPETVKITLHGRLPVGVMARDVALFLLGQFGPDGLDYKAVEVHGSGIKGWDIEERAALCTMGVEMGTKAMMVPADEVTLVYAGVAQDLGYVPDLDAQYERDLQYDLGGLAPMVSKPFLPTNAVPVGEVLGTRIDQGVIGSCAGGSLPDLEIAARILEGKQVRKGVRLIITPSSKENWIRADEKGLLKILKQAGAVVSSPACGACGGYEIGCLAPGEVCISTTTRNMPGRMGPGGEVYLASAATVAASALAGEIVDPRPYLNERPAWVS